MSMSGGLIPLGSTGKKKRSEGGLTGGLIDIKDSKTTPVPVGDTDGFNDDDFEKMLGGGGSPKKKKKKKKHKKVQQNSKQKKKKSKKSEAKFNDKNTAVFGSHRVDSKSSAVSKLANATGGTRKVLTAAEELAEIKRRKQAKHKNMPVQNDTNSRTSSESKSPEVSIESNDNTIVTLQESDSDTGGVQNISDLRSMFEESHDDDNMSNTSYQNNEPSFASGTPTVLGRTRGHGGRKSRFRTIDTNTYVAKPDSSSPKTTNTNTYVAKTDPSSPKTTNTNTYVAKTDPSSPNNLLKSDDSWDDDDLELPIDALDDSKGIDTDTNNAFNKNDKLSYNEKAGDIKSRSQVDINSNTFNIGNLADSSSEDDDIVKLREQARSGGDTYFRKDTKSSIHDKNPTPEKKQKKLSPRVRPMQRRRFQENSEQKKTSGEIGEPTRNELETSAGDNTKIQQNVESRRREEVIHLKSQAVTSTTLDNLAIEMQKNMGQLSALKSQIVEQGEGHLEAKLALLDAREKKIEGWEREAEELKRATSEEMRKVQDLLKATEESTRSLTLQREEDRVQLRRENDRLESVSAMLKAEAAVMRSTVESQQSQLLKAQEELANERSRNQSELQLEREQLRKDRLYLENSRKQFESNQKFKTISMKKQIESVNKRENALREAAGVLNQEHRRLELATKKLSLTQHELKEERLRLDEEAQMLKELGIQVHEKSVVLGRKHSEAMSALKISQEKEANAIQVATNAKRDRKVAEDIQQHLLNSRREISEKQLRLGRLRKAVAEERLEAKREMIRVRQAKFEMNQRRFSVHTTGIHNTLCSENVGQFQKTPSEIPILSDNNIDTKSIRTHVHLPVSRHELQRMLDEWERDRKKIDIYTNQEEKFLTKINDTIHVDEQEEKHLDENTTNTDTMKNISIHVDQQEEKHLDENTTNTDTMKNISIHVDEQEEKHLDENNTNTDTMKNISIHVDEQEEKHLDENTTNTETNSMSGGEFSSSFSFSDDENI